MNLTENQVNKLTDAYEVLRCSALGVMLTWFNVDSPYQSVAVALSELLAFLEALCLLNLKVPD